jgi:hypothetical protein
LTSVSFLDTAEADFIQRPEPARSHLSKKTAVREVLSWGPRSIEIEHLSSEKDGEIKKNSSRYSIDRSNSPKNQQKYPKMKNNDSIVALS